MQEGLSIMQQDVKLSLIVARARGGVIGANGDLPWHLKDDLKAFKKATFGCPVLMGRKTWESLPIKPLPGRENIVLTRDWQYDAIGARVYSSFAPALNAARAIALKGKFEEVFVIGGEAIYRKALPLADRLYITEVDAEVEGDAFFPQFDESNWREISNTPYQMNEDNDHDFVIRMLERE